MRRIAIIGGGIAGLTAAYELARLSRDGVPVEAVLFESSNRLGGIIETVREGGFTVETGPDAWVTSKPWARELAVELGLDSDTELIPSNDATRKTHIFLATPDYPASRLVPMPDGLNMMVPTDLDALALSPLFTESAIAAYRAEPARAAEFLASIPAHDESVADFTLRHFGREVLDRVAAPLLNGVFGGDVRTLSARAVLPALVQMERERGSLIAAAQANADRKRGRDEPLFTTLRTGLGTLIDRLVAVVPPHWFCLNTTVTAIEAAPRPEPIVGRFASEASGSSPRLWTVLTSSAGKRLASEAFDAVLLAVPLDATRQILELLDATASQLLPAESSSAVLVAFCFPDATRFPLPPGFGFLVPPEPPPGEGSVPPAERGRMGAYRNVSGSAEKPVPSVQKEPWHIAFTSPRASTSRPSLLLACTFADQKFHHRVPPGGRLIRAFFGGATADRIARCNNDEIAAIARLELARILNTNANSPVSGPAPVPILTVVRRLPNSLPQYAVGHLDRVAELESRLRAFSGLALLGNSLRGVGLPDLIRDSRQAARTAALSPTRT